MNMLGVHLLMLCAEKAVLWNGLLKPGLEIDRVAAVCLGLKQYEVACPRRQRTLISGYAKHSVPSLQAVCIGQSGCIRGQTSVYNVLLRFVLFEYAAFILLNKLLQDRDHRIWRRSRRRRWRRGGRVDRHEKSFSNVVRLFSPRIHSVNEQ